MSKDMGEQREVERRLSAALSDGDEPVEVSELARVAEALDSGERPEGLSRPARELLALASSVDERAVVPTPALRKRLLDRARALFRGPSAKPGPLALIVEWAGDVLDVIQGRQWIVPLAPAVVRSGGSAGEARMLRVRRPVEGGALLLDLEKTGPQRFGLGASVELDVPSAAPIRISLFRGDRELRSDLATSSPVRFANLNPGAYLMRITSSGRPLGELAVEVRGEGNEGRQLT